MKSRVIFLCECIFSQLDLRVDHFSNKLFRCDYGLSDVAIPYYIGRNSNSYGIPILGRHCYGCCLAGERHRFELPEGANRPEMKDNGNVFGCGLVLDPHNYLAIFFTLNGQLLGKLILDILRTNKKNLIHS
jgi:hypothetical protein